MSFVTVRLSNELDERLQRVLPDELSGKRKAELRVHIALREYLANKQTTRRVAKTRPARRKVG